MATAYVKNDALSFYSSPDENAVITKIERSGQTEAYFLIGFSEGNELGILTGKEENGFVEIEHPFDIRRKLTSQSNWYWIFPPAGIAASQLSKWYHETELIWVKKEDITDESPDAAAAAAAAAKKAKTQQLIDSLDKDPALTGNKEGEAKSGNTWLYVAIAGVVALLGGVLWWAFGKKKGPTPAQPTIIQLPKSAK